MAVPSHLTSKLDGVVADSLLSDWRWLVAGIHTPVLMTAFGDLFLRDETGHIHFLDLMSGEFKQVAASQADFERMCEGREQRQRWFISHLVMELRKVHGELAVGQCYGCKVPLSLGGKLDVSNFERTNIQVHFSVLGQLHRQTRQLPPGTKIRDIETES